MAGGSQSGQVPMPVGGQSQTDYRVLVSRGNTRPKAELYAFNLKDPIPVFPVPVQAGDAEPQLDLKQLLEEIYDRAGYSFRLDYQRPVKPALTQSEQQWLSSILA